MSTLKFKVEKMKCNGCENAIHSGLSEIDGIENVATDLALKMVTVTFSKNVTETEISSKLKAIGYEGILVK
jgi:copper chaperone CopZ